MSWSLFKTNCMVLTGPQHISVQLFAQTVANAYHTCMTMHFDSLTAGGILVNNAPKLPLLTQAILAQCTANLSSSSQSTDLIKQIGPAIITYWTALIITGPTGVVTVTSPGSWNSIPVPPNTNFDLWLQAFMLAARTHIMTLTGQYVSSVVPGVVSPWSGALFQTLP